jgi:hypothetical protein
MSAIQFVVLMVMTTVSGVGILLYAGHVFVTIAQQTAGGLDEVTWPKDSWFDWIGRVLHLGWLVVFWVLPLGIVLRIIGPESLATSALLYVGVPAGLFCLLFPMTLLSSFSADSPWVLLRPEALGRMFRAPGTTFAFFLLTAPLCLAGAVAIYVTVASPLYYVLPALATVLFLYARLVGRYARVLGRVRVKRALSKDDKAARRAARAAQVEDPWGAPGENTRTERPRKKKKKRPAEVHDPWAVPEEGPAQDEADGPAVEGYGLAREEPPPEPREKPRKTPRVKGYDVSPEEPPPRPKDVPLDGSPPIEEKRILSESETPLPRRPLIDGVLLFPWYPSNLPVWGLLTLLLLGWAFLYAATLAAFQALSPISSLSGS